MSRLTATETGWGDEWEQKYFHNLDQTPNGDFDGDGLTNLAEALIGTDPTWADTDGDGISDADEVNIYHTNPRSKKRFDHRFPSMQVSGIARRWRSPLAMEH